MYQIKPILYHMDLKPQTLSGDDLKQFCRTVRRWQTRNGVRPWNWSGSPVYQDGKKIGFMAFNGKIFDLPVFNGKGVEI